jgi:hypothetical protein
MSLAEHSSKVSHVDDSLQDVSTLMTLVDLKDSPSIILLMDEFHAS